jgi:hypothetical protein
MALKATNLLAKAGTVVRVVGVTGAPELNGRQGTVKTFDEAKGRYKVLVVGESRPKMLKPDNCRLMPGPDGSNSDSDSDL